MLYFHSKYACSYDPIRGALAISLWIVSSALEMTLHKAGEASGDISVTAQSVSHFGSMFFLQKPFKYYFEVKAAVCVVLQTRLSFWSFENKDIIEITLNLYLCLKGEGWI